jgi:hypothetical protein
MLKIVYLHPRRGWAPTIADVNRVVQSALRLRRSLWGPADWDVECVGFEDDTLSVTLKRLARATTSQ